MLDRRFYIVKYFGFGILLIGALIVYLSKIITKRLKKIDDTSEVFEKYNLYCKLTGLAIALIGIIFIFI